MGGLLEFLEGRQSTGIPDVAAKSEQPSPADIIGDEPITGLPGVRTVDFSSVNQHRFLHAIRNGGFRRRRHGKEIETIELRPLINSLLDKGKHVGVSWSNGKIHIFTAPRKEVFAAIAGIGIAAAVIGTIYLVKHSPRNRKEK